AAGLRRNRRRRLAAGADPSGSRVGRAGGGRRRIGSARLSRPDQPCRGGRVCRNPVASAQPHRALRTGGGGAVVSRPALLLPQRDADLGCVAPRQRRHSGASRPVSQRRGVGAVDRPTVVSRFRSPLCRRMDGSPHACPPTAAMTAGPLASLLLGDDTADRPVASSKGHVIRLQRFRADGGGTAARLATIGCSRGLVACDDAYWGTVGWFALAHNGAETVFPSNTLPATLPAMSGAFDHIVTDGAVTGSERTLRLAHEDGVSTLPPMDAEKACVTLFTSGSTGAPKRVAKTVRQLELEAATVDRLLGAAVPTTAWVHGTVVHNHLYGLTFRLCWPLATHRAFVGKPHQFWEPLLASMDRGSALVTSPSHLSRLGGLAPLPAERR